MLRAGRIGRAHGLDGSFYVTEGRPLLLQEGMEVQLGGRSLAIVRRAGTDAKPIVRLEGVSDRNAAEGLRQQWLEVPEVQAPQLPDGEYWAEELQGCRVHDGEQEVGVVERLVALPSCECLLVTRSSGPGAELLVPMVADAIRHVDIKRQEIDISLAYLGEGNG